jgi:hypothetical protein
LLRERKLNEVASRNAALNNDSIIIGTKTGELKVKPKFTPKKGSRDDIQQHNLGSDDLGLYRNRSSKEEFLRKSQNPLDESDEELLYEVARDRSLTPQQQNEEIKRIKRNLIKEAPMFGKRKQRKQKSKSRRR